MSNPSICGPGRKNLAPLVMALPVKIGVCSTLSSRVPSQKKKVTTLLKAKVSIFI